MYLLTQDSSGGLVLTKFTPGHTPPYAILSHTWGADNEEVVYDDIIKGEGRDKAGWKKLEFCLKRTNNDKLKYFWIDTCCINKANHTELSEAINSMFRWYRDAEKCYVYLADLSIKHYEESGRKRSFRTIDQDLPLEKTWILDFRQSRWFTRGWTLQELLAPRSVEFYSVDGYRLGDRNSLSSVIHAITGIPFAALQGGPLSQYSVDERISWGSSRQTTVAEDAAYSLLGIVGVYMPLIYGEGKVSAFSRLRKEVREKLQPLKEMTGNEIEDLKSLQAWRLTDPREDRERILNNKDPLLKSSCDWILEDLAFKRWWEDDKNHSLWIHGDPGKGKTMMMMALTDEISQRLKENSRLGITAFFFCQNTDQKLNSATAIIRGLLFHLVAENRSLLHHLTKRYEQGGDEIFEGHNTLFTQWSTLLDIAHDPEVPTLYLLVDALDECGEESLRQFLTLLTSARVDWTSKIKWIFTSRNKSYIDEKFAHQRTRCHTSLELNAEHIANAVSSFITFRTEQLTQEKQYGEGLKGEVKAYLHQHSNNTFLWVALVCKELEKVPARKTKKTMQQFPSGLEPLYQRMLRNVTSENDEEDVVLCQKILQAVNIAQKPLHCNEIGHIAGLSEEVATDSQAIEDLVRSCGSFLTMRDRRIYLIHQSAKDFFTMGAGSLIFPISHIEAQYQCAKRCFIIMSLLLKKDLCSFGQPGVLIDDINSATIDKAFPLHAQYACCHWGDHTQEGRVLERDEQLVWKFLQERLLHWLEALSLMKQTIVSIQVVDKLLETIKNQTHNLRTSLHDVKRFLMYCRLVIDQAPLQVYSSALLFAPTESFVRKQYGDDVEPWISLLPKTHNNWSALLQTLDDHKGSVTNIALSPSGKHLASVELNRTIRIWDATTGTLQKTLTDDGSIAKTIAFSQDGKRLMSVSETNINYWDVTTGVSLNTLQDQSRMLIGSIVAFSPERKQLACVHFDIVHLWDVDTRILQHTLVATSSVRAISRIAFSPSGEHFATASSDNICLWDTATGILQNILKHDAKWVDLMAFSPDGTRIASGVGSRMQIWDTATGVLLSTLEVRLSPAISTVTFSPDGKQLATGSDAVRLWDAATGAFQRLLKEGRSVSQVVFSPDGKKLASVSTKTIYLWNPTTGALENRLRGHSAPVMMVLFSPYGKQLVSGSLDSTVRIWDTHMKASLDMSEDHSDAILKMTFSPDSKQLVSGSSDGTIRLWDAATEALRYTVNTHLGPVYSVAFSPDGKQFVSGSRHKIQLWDTSSGLLQKSWIDDKTDIHTVLFAPNGKQVASVPIYETIKLWDLTLGEGALCITLGYCISTEAVVFSPDSKQFASRSPDFGTIEVWNTTTGSLRCRISNYCADEATMAFSPDSKQLASGSWGDTITIWDTNTGTPQRELDGYLKSTTTNQVYRGLKDSKAAVAFSPDGRYITSGGSSQDEPIQLWETATGALQQYWSLGCKVNKLEFSADSTTLEMDCGFIQITPTTSYNQDCTTLSPSCIIDSDNWVRVRGVRAVRIPPDMRPVCSDCKAGKIAIATSMGQILFMNFNPMLFSSRLI